MPEGTEEKVIAPEEPTEEPQKPDLVGLLKGMDPGDEVHINGGVNPMALQKMPGGYVLTMTVQVPIGFAQDEETAIEMAAKLILDAPGGCGCCEGSCGDGGCDIE